MKFNMKAKYFNKWEFSQALSIMETNPTEAKLKYEEYLEKYPKDYSAYLYYVTVLIVLGEFTDAEKIINYVEELSDRDKIFNDSPNRVKRLKENILISRLKLLSYQERYDELYQLCFENSQIIKELDINHLYFYCKKKKGILIPAIREGNSYIFRQIIEYQESDFLQSVQNHLADYNMNIENPSLNIFSSDFPFNEILEEIKKYLPSDKRLCHGFYEDQYIFKYDNCGKDNGKTADYFKVICFHNTKDIIVMYPSADCQNLPYINLNYLIPEPKDCKVRRLSQIDKFNQRYKPNQK